MSELKKNDSPLLSYSILLTESTTAVRKKKRSARRAGGGGGGPLPPDSALEGMEIHPVSHRAKKQDAGILRQEGGLLRL